MTKLPNTVCPLCWNAASEADLKQVHWLDPKVLRRIAKRHPSWRREDGACPACVQEALLETLRAYGDAALHAGIQAVWPLDAEAAFGALPTPLRMHADPHYHGRGVTLALVDSAFYPHPDLTEAGNRIRAWADATSDPARVRIFGRQQKPRWPGWDAGHPAQWHGLMTSVVAAGNGFLSHGLYCGLASKADVVLVETRDEDGRITNATITRALDWLLARAEEFELRIVSLSVAGDPVESLAGNAVDEAVRRLVESNVTVVAAAGNDGERRLLPPATAPEALTVGGLDDKNVFDHSEVELWHSNYGESVAGTLKPELVAPSIWLVAPLLPGTPQAAEALDLFARRSRGDAAGNPEIAPQIANEKLVTPYYKLVEGTSFAAPLVASTIACMLEANPGITPAEIRRLLLAAAHPVPGAPVERQGAGALDSGRAVALALRARSEPSAAGNIGEPQRHRGTEKKTRTVT